MSAISLLLSDPLALRRHLLVQGMYQDSRNPMSLGVFILVSSEALIFDSLHLVFACCLCRPWSWCESHSMRSAASAAALRPPAWGPSMRSIAIVCPGGCRASGPKSLRIRPEKA